MFEFLGAYCRESKDHNMEVEATTTSLEPVGSSRS